MDLYVYTYSVTYIHTYIHIHTNIHATHKKIYIKSNTFHNTIVYNAAGR